MLQEKEEKWPLKPCKLASFSFFLWLRHETLLKTHLHSCIIVDWFHGLVTSTLKLHLVSVDERKLDWSNKINESVAHDPRFLNGGYRHKDGGWIHFNQIAITEKRGSRVMFSSHFIAMARAVSFSYFLRRDSSPAFYCNRSNAITKYCYYIVPVLISSIICIS